MPSDGTSKTSCLVGGLIFGLAIGIYLGSEYQLKKERALERWDRTKAIQYEIAKEDGAKWGEIIHEYERADCEAHRWRYRGIYYIGQVGIDCGPLIQEPTSR